MNRTELLDSLYATRRELLRLIVSSGSATVDEIKLHALVVQRDHVTWVINALIDGELGASVGDIDDACKAIEGAAKALQKLVAIAKDIDAAIGYAKTAIDATTGLVAGLK